MSRRVLARVAFAALLAAPAPVLLAQEGADAPAPAPTEAPAPPPAPDAAAPFELPASASRTHPDGSTTTVRIEPLPGGGVVLELERSAEGSRQRSRCTLTGPDIPWGQLEQLLAEPPAELDLDLRAGGSRARIRARAHAGPLDPEARRELAERVREHVERLRARLAERPGEEGPRPELERALERAREHLERLERGALPPAPPAPPAPPREAEVGERVRVLLEGGDRITGELIERTDEHLRLATPYGELTLERARVRRALPAPR